MEGDKSSFFSAFKASSPLSVRVLKCLGVPLRGFLERGGAILFKLGTSLQTTIDRHRNEQNSMTSLSGPKLYIASIVREEAMRRPRPMSFLT